MVKSRFPGRPSSSLVVCSVKQSICPRIVLEEIDEIYFINFIIPWVRNMQGMLRPRLFIVPCLRAVGSLLQNPAAGRPTFITGDIIFFQSLRGREREGAGYLSVLRMVECMESKAFWGEVW